MYLDWTYLRLNYAGLDSVHITILNQPDIIGLKLQKSSA